MNYSQTIATPKLFIGMDVHKKSWTLHFKTDLFDFKTVTMPADPAKLLDYVQNHFPGHDVRCCYEAGCCGYWIARVLQQHDWKVLIVNPADVPRTHKQSWQKTDKIDCRKLCEHLQKNSLHSITIPTEEQEQLRSLFRRRDHLIRQLRSVRNHIKSQLLYYGIKLPEQFDNPNWSYEMRDWISNVSWKYPTASSAMHSRLRHLDFLWQEQLRVSGELRAYCRKHYRKDYYLYKSVPGIGGIVACCLIAELGDIRRFTRLDELASIVGLIPGVYQSSDTSINLGLTRRSKSHLRSLLIESSWVAVRTDMALQAYYRKHAAIQPNKAIIKVAHKLLGRIRAVIGSSTPYQTGLVK